MLTFASIPILQTLIEQNHLPTVTDSFKIDEKKTSKQGRQRHFSCLLMPGSWSPLVAGRNSPYFRKFTYQSFSAEKHGNQIEIGNIRIFFENIYPKFTFDAK